MDSIETIISSHIKNYDSNNEKHKELLETSIFWFQSAIQKELSQTEENNE